MDSPSRPAGPRTRRLDYFDVLGLRRDATYREIEAAYWRLAHERRDQLPLLNEAWEVLGNPERRDVYKAEQQLRLPEQPVETPCVPRRPSLREKLNW